VHETVIAELILAFEDVEGAVTAVHREGRETAGGIWAGLVGESETPRRSICPAGSVYLLPHQLTLENGKNN